MSAMGESSEPDEEPRASRIDLIAATPLGDILLFAVVCLASAGLTFAFRTHPFISLGVGAAFVVIIVGAVGRRAQRSQHRWRASQYLAFGLLTAVVVGIAVVALLAVATLVCDC
jgi:hypothetical protein